jgi:Domain of unknown function (DUF5069)
MGKNAEAQRTQRAAENFLLCVSPRSLRLGVLFLIRVHPCLSVVDFFIVSRMIFPMSEIIYPRSPRETMDGWHYLPRYVDKIRLHLAGKLHADYHENLGKAFDGFWLKAAGVTHEQFVLVVKNSITDGEVCDWVRKNVKKSAAEKAAHWQDVLSRPLPDNAEAVARLKMRKEQAGIAHREDIKCFVDMLDADEKRI